MQFLHVQNMLLMFINKFNHINVHLIVVVLEIINILILEVMFVLHHVIVEVQYQ